jgi:hypothetical protein
VSVFLPLEQAALAHVASDRERTALFARYSLVGALVAALGALAAGTARLVGRRRAAADAIRAAAYVRLYGAIGLVTAMIYRKLPADFAADTQATTAPLKESKRIVYILAALFSLDAFGGGFIVQSMLALWMFERFQLSVGVAAAIFFWTGVFTAFRICSRCASPSDSG